jgi:hypothetical protein
VPMRLPGKAAAAFRDGANLAPDRAVGRRTWEEFLAQRSHFGDEPLRLQTHLSSPDLRPRHDG